MPQPPRQTTEGEITDASNKTVAQLGNGIETLTRKDLGKLFNVSHEAIRLWEESGRLKELGWERAGHIKSPVKYSRTNQPAAPAPLTSALG